MLTNIKFKRFNSWMIKLVLASVFTVSSGIASADKVSIGALVAGQVTQVYVEEGQTVKAGTLLLEIDAQAHHAKIAFLKAEVALQQAIYSDAKVELEQALDLFDRTVTSKRTLDSAQLQHDVALSALNKAKAQLKIEQAWSKYYRIKSPISGKVEKIHAPLGSTVFKENSPLIDLQ
ncbi:MAG: biotin/lipoyl-binding protein [Pseudomonadota bacterium]|nr:biotin/lipoyl-binding protein [Pseudomonadota bacterium]